MLDANILIPAALRDTLLRAAEYRLYRPLWSATILTEVERNLVENGLTDARGAQRLVRAMQEAFPEALVEGYSDLIPRLTNNPKDRHVLAAAIVGEARTIVTHNLRDFPASALTPHGIEARSPDRFLGQLFDLEPDVLIRVVQEQAAALRRRPRTPHDILDRLARQVPNFAQKVRGELDRREV